MNELETRDYFAGQALHAIMSGPIPKIPPGDRVDKTVGEFIAHKAYVMADYMMAERAHGVNVRRETLE